MAMEGVNINQRRRGAELENVVGGGGGALKYKCNAGDYFLIEVVFK